MSNASLDVAQQIKLLTIMFNNRLIPMSEFRLLMDATLAAVNHLAPCYDEAVTDCGDYALRVVPWSAR